MHKPQRALLSLLTTKPCSSASHLRQIHALLLTSALLRRPEAFNLLLRSTPYPLLALLLFNIMRHHSLRPDRNTFPFALKASAALRLLPSGRRIHADALKRGCTPNVYVANSLVSFYSSCHKIFDARKVFDEMSERTVVSYNALLTAFVDNNRPQEVISLFRVMNSNCGFDLDATTFVVVLSASAELGNLSLGRFLHWRLIANSAPEVNVQLGTALVNMYAKCGAVRDARVVFDTMPERNVWMWSAMILGYAQHGFAGEALELFNRMNSSGIAPNYVTFLGLLCACSHAGLVDEALAFFYDMQNVHGIEPRMTHYSAMVDVLGRNGRLEEACRFVEAMPIEPEAVVLRTLLSTCGVDKVGERVRRRLMELEPRRCGNYVMVANMYAGAGQWEAAARMRRRMREEGLKKAAGESCIEVGGVVRRFVSGCGGGGDGDLFEMLDCLNLNSRKSDSSLDMSTMFVGI